MLFQPSHLFLEASPCESHIINRFSSVQSLSHVWLFATPWTAARQASLSITKLLMLTSIESVMPSNHLILCHPLLLPPSIFPSVIIPVICMGFPGGSGSKESACNTGDPGSIPGLGRSPGEGNGNPLQYYFLKNPIDGGACQATVYAVAKSQTWLRG